MKNLLFILILISPLTSFGWGQIGHRIVGEIAEKSLNKEGLKAVNKILGTQSLADVSNWADFIKSDPKWKKAYSWHYTTVEDGKSYKEMKTNKSGDVVWAINHFCKVLGKKTAKAKEKKQALKFLVHFVGDIHQPLHVGTGLDRGGNDVKISWFNQQTNLHRVWDDLLIKMQDYSYTEYVKNINHATDQQIKKWKSGTINTWINESIGLRKDVYDIIKNKSKYKKNPEFNYNYKNIKNLNTALLKAGHRLAAKIESCIKK